MFSFWTFWEKYGRFGALGIGIGLVVLGIFFGFLKEKSTPEMEFFPTQEVIKQTNQIIVDLAGAVNKPGVYQLEEGSRINQLIELAGGFNDQADKQWVGLNLNQARKLVDGEKIYIPKQGESNVSSSQVAGATSSLININLASQKGLEALPGIGPSFAERIIDYRQNNNGFKSIEEIMAVPGIGKKIFEKIKEKVTI